MAGIVLVERQLAAAREDLIELDVVAAQRALQGVGTHAAGGAKVEDTHGYPVCCVSSAIVSGRTEARRDIPEACKGRKTDHGLYSQDVFPAPTPAEGVGQRIRVRQSVVEGTGVAVRGEHGGRRLTKK